MGPIMLEINNYSNLLEAWTGNAYEEIQDYNYKEVAASFMDETPMGQSPSKTKTYKELWISELPSVLFFTIQRVNYDLKKMKLVKNAKRFEFDKMIYADKFMLQNRLRDDEINAQILALREK